jgi:hypothetical protein
MSKIVVVILVLIYHRRIETGFVFYVSQFFYRIGIVTEPIRLCKAVNSVLVFAAYIFTL